MTFLSLLSATCLALGLAATTAAAEVWTPVAPLPRGLAGFAASAGDRQILVAGGTAWDGERKLTLADVYAYAPAADRWEARASWPRAFAFGVFGPWQETLVAWGGQDETATRADRADRISSAALPEPLGYAGSAVLTGKLYTVGGTPDVGRVAAAHARMQTIDLATGAVDSLPDFPGGPSINVAVAAAGERLWVFGGGSWDVTAGRLRNSAESWCYDPATRAWRALAPLPAAGRGIAALALDDRHVLLAGGFVDHPDGARVTDACAIYDTTTDRYTPAPSLPVAVMLTALVRLDGHIYALGGEDAPRHRSAHAHRALLAALLNRPL